MQFLVVGFPRQRTGQQYDGPCGVIDTGISFLRFCSVGVVRGKAIYIDDINWHAVDRGFGDEMVEMVKTAMGKEAKSVPESAIAAPGSIATKLRHSAASFQKTILVAAAGVAGRRESPSVHLVEAQVVDNAERFLHPGAGGAGGGASRFIYSSICP